MALRFFIFNLFIFFLGISVSQAHEYWLEPESFFLKPGGKSAIRMFVRERLKPEEERPFQASKTSLFKMYSAGGDFDLLGSGREGQTPIFTFSSLKEGTFLLALERNWSYITLSPTDFENYLREDGMEYIITERRKLGETDKDGKERYSRYLKSLIQVGARRDRTFRRQVGLSLEIIPLENPYAKKRGDQLKIQILFRGKPLGNKTIFSDVRNGNDIETNRYETDSNGTAAVKLTTGGVWLIRVVHMERCPVACEGADWQSFWAAVTFGLK